MVAVKKPIDVTYCIAAGKMFYNVRKQHIQIILTVLLSLCVTACGKQAEPDQKAVVELGNGIQRGAPESRNGVQEAAAGSENGMFQGASLG